MDCEVHCDVNDDKKRGTRTEKKNRCVRMIFFFLVTSSGFTKEAPRLCVTVGIYGNVASWNFNHTHKGHRSALTPTHTHTHTVSNTKRRPVSGQDKEKPEPCVGRPCCVRPTSLSPSGSRAQSPFSDWLQTPPSCRERATSGWEYGGGGREQRRPSPPDGRRRTQNNLLCIPLTEKTPQSPPFFTRVSPLDPCTVPLPRTPAVHRSAGRGAAESWRSFPRRGWF